MFNNPADPSNCFIDIQAGAGGTEACDWAAMLLRQYLKYCERKGFKTEVMEETEGDVAGIRSATIKVEGDYAFGLLRTETGVHRLVRKSPFDSAGGRHTSFASLFVYPEVDDSIEIDINPADVRTDTFRASGAGGQHINKTDSAVRLTHIPTGIVVQCQNDRSQHRNRDEAWQMLRSRLYEHEMRMRMAAQQKLEDTKTDVGWGHQIRSYVLDQSRIKDLRTNVEISNTQKRARRRSRPVHRGEPEAGRLRRTRPTPTIGTGPPRHGVPLRPTQNRDSMREATAPVIRREDYAPPAYWIRTVDLTFDLDPAKTMVINRMQVERNARRAAPAAAAARRGAEPDARAGRRRDGVVPPRGRHAGDRQPAGCRRVHARGPQHLRAGQEHRAVRPVHLGRRLLHAVRGRGLPAHHLLPRPARRDGGLHGHAARRRRRRTRCCCRTATWSSRAISTTAATSPSGTTRSRSRAICSRWSPPTWSRREQHIRTRRGKDHLLQVYVRRGDLDKTEHAMNSLVASVVWDEARFGLPLDLERFMIVAVGDFNMGAMENKGLNIFNTKYVLANPATATDADYSAHRIGRRPRVLPQLDRQPHHLPRLVPAVA